MLKKAADFLKKNGNKKTIIIYDIDGDGIGSAVLLAKTLKRLFKKTPKAMPASHSLFFITKEMFQEIKNKKFEVIITVDIAVDELPSYILKLAKESKVLIIDHHQFRRNLNKVKNIMHVNPSLQKLNEIPPNRYCTSKIVYDILNQLTDIEDLNWLAGIGIINDRSEDSWKDFLNKIYEKYPVLKTEIRYLKNIITSGYIYSEIKGTKLGYKACLESSSPIDILEGKSQTSKKLKKMYNSVEREIVSTIKNWEKNAEIIKSKNLIILKLNTKFNINSPVSTKISLKKPNYTFLVLKRKGKMINVSFRRQDGKVNCGKLAYLSTKNLKNANGGGHIPAAGAIFMTKDWNKFREKILKLT